MPKVMYVILLGDLNIRMREPRDDREDKLALPLAGSGLGYATAHLTLRWRY